MVGVAEINPWQGCDLLNLLCNNFTIVPDASDPSLRPQRKDVLQFAGHRPGQRSPYGFDSADYVSVQQYQAPAVFDLDSDVVFLKIRRTQNFFPNSLADAQQCKRLLRR